MVKFSLRMVESGFRCCKLNQSTRFYPVFVIVFFHRHMSGACGNQYHPKPETALMILLTVLRAYTSG